SADVTVTPREDLEASVPTGAVRTLPASLAERLSALDGVASAHPDVEADNITVVDEDDRSGGSTTGAPTLAVDWHVSEQTVVGLTSGSAPRGPGPAVLDANTADSKDVGTGATLTGQAPPGAARA